MSFAPPYTRLESIGRARALGLAVVAALPYHVPRALLRAHRCHAVEVWAPPARSSPDRPGGSRHFPSYTCSIVSVGTDFLLAGGMRQVDAILVPHGCDALQGMGSVLTDFVPDRPPVLTVYPPRSRRPVDGDYYRAELRALGARLEELTGHVPTGEDWSAAFAVEDAADEALRDISARRAQISLDDRDFRTAVRAREYLLAEDFLAMAGALPAGAAPRPGVGLVLSGIVAEPVEILDVLAGAGAHVAADDLSTGSRRLLPAAELPATPDPYRRLSEQFLRGPADPTRTDPVRERADRLVGLLRGSGAAGLLIYTPAFCEPELFYLPLIREHVIAAGYPVLHVEFEAGRRLPSQTVTRVEAFVESLAMAERVR